MISDMSVGGCDNLSREDVGSGWIDGRVQGNDDQYLAASFPPSLPSCCQHMGSKGLHQQPSQQSSGRDIMPHAGY